MNRTYILGGLAAVAVIALGVMAYIAFFANPGDTIADTQGVYTITLSPNDHTLGSPNAPVQVVEYAAPTCPVCAYWDKNVFPAFKKEYVDTGKVHYIFRVFPLRSTDVAVEAMARCLPKENYFQFIDMMYRNQDKWDPDGHNIPDVHAALIKMGRIAGLGADKVDTCISNQPELNKISAIGQHAAKVYGINSTPSFIIDGVFHQQDFMTPETMSETLDKALRQKGH